MPLYMYRNNRPNFSLAMDSYSRYMFSPKHSHKLALKRLACYLNQTKDCGLVLEPNSDVCKLEAYPDANFDGMYGN